MRMRKFKSPLSIFVMWHPKFTDGKSYSKLVYNTFNGGNDNVTHAKYSIPVHYRSLSVEEGTFAKIPFTESVKNAVIILVDEHMFNDPDWTKSIDKLLKNKPPNTRIFPVAFTEYAFHFNPNFLSPVQFIKAYSKGPKKRKNKVSINKKLIKFRLLEGVAKFLFNVKENYDAEEHSDPPIKLFISHAKHDGEDLAIKFRDYIYRNTKLKAFFDANDIADGHQFEKEIRKNIDRSAFVIFNTDEYSNRDWCRREVIIAKRYRCPIIGVIDIKKGENRSFPYSGNFPTIIWNENFEEVINLTLSQVISDKYNELYLKSVVKLYGLEKKYSCLILPKAPELFNFIDIENFKNKEKNVKSLIVLYPDPPIGIEELTLLNDLDKNIQFITPILLPTFINDL